ncbi:MAG: magnesium transporter [Acidobacteriaceae bacterium]
METQVAHVEEALRSRWPRLTHAERLQQFRELHTGEKADFFVDLSAHDQSDLLIRLPEGQRHVWMRLLAPDDAADLIQEAIPERRDDLLSLLDEPTRKEVNALLAYKEDEAGGLMSPRFARLRPDSTVDEAISYLRRQASALETIYYAYVLDHNQRLQGVISLRELFSADPTRLMHTVMHTNLMSVDEDADQKMVADIIRDSRLLAVPVLDGAGRMVGIVTVDDIVDVVEEEATRDIQNVGGTSALDGPYLHAPFLDLVRKRAGWLMILFIGEMFTATAMGFFENEIQRAVVLALFLPLIISSGGNSGSQATTLVIQAMATGDVKLMDWFRVIRREVFVGLALGAILGVIGLVRIFAWEAVFHLYGAQTALLAVTILCSLIGVVAFGSVAGATLPFILRRFGLNPASASAPFVATLVDVTGLVIYFSIARMIMLRPH